MKDKLLVDLSSIVQVYTHREDEFSERVTFEGKKFIIPDASSVVEQFTEDLIETLNKLDLSPRDVILVKDPINSREIRQRVYPEYKGKRTPRPPEYYKEFQEALDEICKAVMGYGGLVAAPQKGYEADDLLNELSRRLPGTVIWTRDHDMLASGGLIYIKGEFNPAKFPVTQASHIRLYKTLVGDGSDNIPGCRGFGPAKFDELLKIFGEEGLDLLIGLFENRKLDLLQEDVGEFKHLQKLIDQSEDLYKYWQVVGFYKIRSQDVRWQVGMAKKGFKLRGFEQWEPHEELITNDKLTPEFKQKFAEQARASDYIALDIETDVPPESAAWCKSNGIKVDVRASELCGLSVTFTNNTSYYFSVDHKDTDNCSSEEVRLLIASIPQTTPIICQNGVGFELPVLYGEWGEKQLNNGWHGFLPNMLDTQLAASYWDENQKPHLKGLSGTILKYAQVSYAAVVGDRSGMRALTGEEVVDYGIDDVITTSALWNFFSVFMQYENTFETFKKVEQLSSYVTAKIFYDGCDVDINKLYKLQAEDADELVKVKHDFDQFLIDNKWRGTVFEPFNELTPAVVKEVYKVCRGAELKTQFRLMKKLGDLIGGELGRAVKSEDLAEVNKVYKESWKPDPQLNFRSPAQVITFLHDWLELPKRVFNKPTAAAKKKGAKKGSSSTGEPALLSAIAHGDHGLTDPETTKEILEMLLKMRELATRDSLFYTKLPKFIHWKTGLLHPQLRQCGTTSRRFAPNKYNVNQLPKRGEGKKIRGCFIPHDKDADILALDISGEELRIMAEASQCPEMLSCFVGNNLKDVHTITGYGIAQARDSKWDTYESFSEAVQEEVTEAGVLRSLGKRTNFACQFGAQAPKLSQTLLVPEKEAQAFLDARLKMFPGVAKYEKEYRTKIKKDGYATTFLDARRHLHKQFKTGGAIGGKAERSGYNFRIQGSAAEILKLVFGNMWESGILFKYNCKLMFPVHDEVVISVHKEDMDEFICAFHPIMVKKYSDMKVPLVSDVKVGADFGDLYNYNGWKDEKNRP